MRVSRGNVVLLDFPFSDASGSKVRPAIVIQNDAINRRLTSTMVVLVTKTVHRARSEATQFLIEVDSPAGKVAGLRFDSEVTCTNRSSDLLGSWRSCPENRVDAELVHRVD